MATAFEAELKNTEPDVPFRATTSHHHATWAKTFHSYPELYLRPRSLAEIQKIVTLARRCRRRLVLVGCAHSPSELTCTSSWMVNLDDFSNVLNVDKSRKTITVEAGIRLHDLNLAAKDEALTIPNLGSIDSQSIAGAIATATHGSSSRNGLLSQSVRSLRIVLSNGSAVRCSAEQNVDLFRAALVSLGALGIIVEVEFELVPATNIEWVQTLVSLQRVLDDWSNGLWDQAEFTRVWWLPYMKRAIIWRADKTDKPHRPPQSNWYGGSVGFHTYHILLFISNYIPPILPYIEWFVFGMQYGFTDGATITGVEEQRTGLLMNCLYSQFVNEWSLPLSKGPEAITRLSAWMHGDTETAQIPVSPRGTWVHCPVEVRISDTTLTNRPRPFLDSSQSAGPTLYLNATLYRPYLQDPPCRQRYYEAFEWLMKDMGGKPHWAKNFQHAGPEYFQQVYGEDLKKYVSVRNDVDPDGMFVGPWHRRTILPSVTETGALPLEEEKIGTKHNRGEGGEFWFGEQASKASIKGEKGLTLRESSSEESFDLMHGAETEVSQVLTSVSEEELLDPDEIEGHKVFTRENSKGTWTGTDVFDKM